MLPGKALLGVGTLRIFLSNVQMLLRPRFLNYMGEFWLIGFFDEWTDPTASVLMPPLRPAQKAFHPFTNWLELPRKKNRTISPPMDFKRNEEKRIRRSQFRKS